MVIVQIIGGLGNQLFQYAAGRALANYHNVELKLDITAFERNDSQYIYRIFSLDNFNIEKNIAGKNEIKDLINKYNLPGKIISNIDRLKRYKGFLYTHYQEPNLKYFFDSNFFKAKPKVYLRGYWQSEKYFYSIRHIIKEEFNFNYNLNKDAFKFLKKIKKQNSVGLHIRRGDYISNPIVKNEIGSCSLSYYQGAVNKMKKRIEKPFFFVLSDDIKWARTNLNLGSNSLFIVDETMGMDSKDQAFIDFQLMSYCQHQIISNSSFSWWAAWLNKNPEKIIIAPKPWFNRKRKDDSIYPKDWLRISKY